MAHVAVFAAVFAVTFLAELPDKSLFATLVLGTRYNPLYAWAGTAVAFAVHVAIAVAAGQALATLLPHRLLEAIVAGLFVAGAVYLLVTSFRHEDREGMDAVRQGEQPPSFTWVAGMAFAVVFLAEWGDITQVTTANLTARYDDPVSVFLGATLGLWAAAALAVAVGAKSLNIIPMAWVRRISAAILFGFGIYSAIAAITG
jgi:putative Ca2+/H+ antiporter (TMEM165/GDT1 family)